jgi:hypothetical protein
MLKTVKIHEFSKFYKIYVQSRWDFLKILKDKILFPQETRPDMNAKKNSFKNSAARPEAFLLI